MSAAGKAAHPCLVSRSLQSKVIREPTITVLLKAPVLNVLHQEGTTAVSPVTVPA